MATPRVRSRFLQPLAHSLGENLHTMSDRKLLVNVQHGPDTYRCELYDRDVHGIECQWSRNGVLLQTQWYTRASLAVQWAEHRRSTVLAGTVEWA